MRVFLSVVITLIAGYVGTILGNYIDLPEVGCIFATAAMGAMIICAIQNKKD